MYWFRQFKARETSVLSTQSLRNVYLLIKLENEKIRLEKELVRNISFGNCIGSMAWSFEQIHFLIQCPQLIWLHFAAGFSPRRSNLTVECEIMRFTVCINEKCPRSLVIDVFKEGQTIKILLIQYNR